MEAGRLAPTIACKDVATDRIGSYRNVDIVLVSIMHPIWMYIDVAFIRNVLKPLRQQDVATDN